MVTEAVKQFIISIKNDKKLIQSTQQRDTNYQASFEKGLDHAVKVAAERGFHFTAAELSQALKELSVEKSKATNEQLQKVAGGVLGFTGIRVGLSNPTEVMCQYHAPLEFLERRES
jgi:hypothetical protein